MKICKGIEHYSGQRTVEFNIKLQFHYCSKTVFKARILIHSQQLYSLVIDYHLTNNYNLQKQLELENIINQ